MEDSSTVPQLTLQEADLTQSPLELFQSWFDIAVKHSGLNDPNAISLSTLGEDGYPDSRMVLLKEFNERGFVFYTNAESQKGRALIKYPKAALTIYWDSLKRQVRIKGDVEVVENEVSDSYFSTRPRQSQLGAWASLQSQRLESRETFEKRVAEFSERFPQTVPRPPHWHGFRIKPIRIEFWQDRRNRLHDRFVYTLNADGWSVSRLYP